MYGPIIDKVVVKTGDRTDAVTYTLGGPNAFGDGPVTPADLEVHWGAGHDALLVDAGAGWSNSPAHPTWRIDVTGGAGVERSAFRFGGAKGNLDLEDRLGGERNTVDVMIAGNPTEAAFPVFLKMNFFGAGGTDVVRTIIGVSDPTGARMYLNAALALSLIGGGGRSSLDVSYSNVEVYGAQTFVCPDDNGVQLRFRNVVVNAPLAVAFTGGGGDRSGSTSAIIVNWTGGPLDGFVSVTEHGGPFVDDIRVIYDFNPQPEPPGKPQDLRGSAELHVPRGDPFDVAFTLAPAQPAS
jgi:hypothetical protein